MLAKEENVRLDKYLSKELDISRNRVQNLIKDNKVLVNGKETSSNYLLHLNDDISVELVEDKNQELEGENIPLDIVYEDEYLAIINKPSGMVVHPAAGNYSHTLVNALLYKYDIEDVGDSNRPGIVHRIDKDTSGLMVIAKDAKTQELLGEMIKKHDIERIYLALGDGIIMHDTGDIDAPIGRSLDDRKKMTVTSVNSKEAFTHFKVLERFKNDNKTLIECKLETGRTHQIRVHMEYIGYPIYNDPLYGKSKNTTEFGQFLHSKSIRFIHPITKKELYYEVEPPKEFQDYLEKLENNQQ